MQIEQEMHGDVAVLSIRDAILTGPDVAPFHERVKALAKDGVCRVVVDFSRAPWFGSAMLGALIGSVTTLRRAGGDLRLAGLTDRMMDVLRVSHLERVFQTLNSADQGVESFMG